MAAAVVLLAAWAAPAVAGPPALPSTFWGTVQHADGQEVQIGTVVWALVDGRVCGEGRVHLHDGRTVYLLHAMADDTDTTEKDGGREGDAIIFHVCDTPVEAVATWHGGTSVQLDLVIPAGVLCGEPPPTNTPRPTLPKPVGPAAPTATPRPPATAPDAVPGATTRTGGMLPALDLPHATPTSGPRPADTPSPSMDGARGHGAVLPVALAAGAVVVAGAGAWRATRRHRRGAR